MITKLADYETTIGLVASAVAVTKDRDGDQIVRKQKVTVLARAYEDIVTYADCVDLECGLQIDAELVSVRVIMVADGHRSYCCVYDVKQS